MTAEDGTLSTFTFSFYEVREFFSDSYTSYNRSVDGRILKNLIKGSK